MYIHWTHYFLPKVFGLLSFVFNPAFIYLASSDGKSCIGRYRYLLIGFAVFDVIYSAVEMAVPVAIDGTGTAFVIFVTDGFFFEPGPFSQLAISIRCGFISLSYGILAIHFIYRYIVLFEPGTLDRLTRPSGLFVLLVYFLLHGVVWVLTCQYFLYGDEELADNIHDTFEKTYDVDSHQLVMLISLYFNGSHQIMMRSWTGILILTAISVYAILLYVVLGYRIMKKLADNPGVSKTTQKLHRQLFRALAVQTFIPICISFSPCMAAWYAPALGIDLGMWNNYLGVIALSAFPVLDPLAIIVLLPNYRNKVFGFVKTGAGLVTSSMSSRVVRL